MNRLGKLEYIEVNDLDKYDIADLIAIKMRNQRIIHGLTQEELAHEAGIDRAYVRQVERCEKNITVKTLVKIAHSFGLQIHEFLDFSDIIKDEEDI